MLVEYHSWFNEEFDHQTHGKIGVARPPEIFDFEVQPRFK